MVSIPNVLKGDVVKSETLFEAMMSGALGGFVTPIIQNYIPQSLPMRPILGDIAQVAIGTFAGRAIGGKVGKITQNALVYGAATHLGAMLANQVMNVINPED